MKLAGYSVEYFALLILIILSSNGYRITSRTLRLNSGSSSKRKDLPHCNSFMVSHKDKKNDQNMHHKAIHNHKDSESKSHCQIN